MISRTTDPRAVRLLLAIGLVIVVAGLGWWQLRPARGPDDAADYYAGLGHGLVAVATRVAGPDRAIVVVSLDPERVNDPAVREPLEALRVAAERGAGPRLAAVVTLEQDALPASVEELLIPAALFRQILREHPDAGAIVSLAGAPDLTAAEARALAGRAPPLIVVSPLWPRLRELFAAGLLTCAVTPRFENFNRAAAAPRTAAEWFERYHQVVDQAAALRLAESAFYVTTGGGGL